MPYAEHTVTVNRPARVVFGYLADGMNNRDWRNGVLVIKRTNSIDGVGATYHQITSTGPGGWHLDESYRVTVFDPPRRLEFLVTAGPARPTGVMELTENSDQSTRVQFSLDLKSVGPLRFLGPYITRRLQREVDALDNLKAILERAP